MEGTDRLQIQNWSIRFAVNRAVSVL